MQVISPRRRHFGAGAMTIAFAAAHAAAELDGRAGTEAPAPRLVG